MTTPEIKTDSYPLGFFSDCHGRVDLLDKMIAAHPEVKQWFFLGDVLCFRKPENNMIAGKWVEKHTSYAIKKVMFLKGNHDHVCAKGYLNIDHKYAWIIAQFERSIKLILPNGKNLLLTHSKPKDFWDFINVGYTEREFDDDFGDYIDDNTIACIGGHTHKALSHRFFVSDTVLISLGAAFNGEYGIMTEKGFSFKKL